MNGCNAAKKVIAQNKGVSVFAERTNSIAATDLTEQARAMNGADAILDYNFPNPLAVMSKQLVDNGVNVPHIDGASAGIIANAGAVTGEAATNLKGVDDCVPTVDKRPKVKKWVAAYTAKYGMRADLLVGAGRTTSSTSSPRWRRRRDRCTPAKLLKAIPKVTYEGICTDLQGRRASRCCRTRPTS